jgi:hypothetical protein
MDSQGILEVGRGVYKTLFLMAGLEMAQAVQDLIYLMTSSQILGNKNVSVERTQFYPH